MTAYAVAYLRRPDGALHPDVLEYMERVKSTVEAYGGEFLVHGAQVDVKEGSWDGDLVLVGFPDLRRAQEWYDSAEYEAIKQLRTDHLDGDTLIVDGVPPGYDPASLAGKIRAASASAPRGDQVPVGGDRT